MPSDTSTEPSPLFGARVAGALWLIVILVSIVAVIGGISLDLHGDPGTMAANALENPFISPDSPTELTIKVLFAQPGLPIAEQGS